MFYILNVFNVCVILSWIYFWFLKWVFILNFSGIFDVFCYGLLSEEFLVVEEKKLISLSWKIIFLIFEFSIIIYDYLMYDYLV